MNRGAWWTTVHTGIKSWTQLSDLAHRLKRCWEVPGHSTFGVPTGKRYQGKGPFYGLQNCNLRFPLLIPGCKLKSSSVCIICIKSKGEKERYTHLNAEFQRIARRDKEAFQSDQCKEIEETNRMGKTRDLFKKIRDTKGTFHS